MAPCVLTSWAVGSFALGSLDWRENTTLRLINKRMKTLQIIFAIICAISCEFCLQSAPPSGTVVAWGWNTSTDKTAHVQIVLSNAIAISPGRLHCLALKEDGTVVQWGWDARGMPVFENTLLTTGKGGSAGASAEATTWVQPNGIVRTADGQVLSNIMAIAAGDGFSLGLKRDGTVMSWGKHSSHTVPSNAVAVAAAGFSCLAVTSNGIVIEWVSEKSLPQFGQLLPVPNVSNVVAVASGCSAQGPRNVAIGKDGTVTHWGTETDYKDDRPPGGLSNVTSVAVGYNHTLALKRDGTVIGWGFNNAGQATGGPTLGISAGQVTFEGRYLNNVISVAAGRGYSMALKQDGTVVAWGRIVNDRYPATVPDGLSNVVAIAAGENFCLAITTNATAFKAESPGK